MLDGGGTIISDKQQSSYSSAYMKYPENRPFINTKWVSSSYLASKAFPESNRDCNYLIFHFIL